MSAASWLVHFRHVSYRHQAPSGRLVALGTPRPHNPAAPTREELEACREYLLHFVYPAALHPRVDDGVVAAAIRLDHMTPRDALDALLGLSHENPLVCGELARAALALGYRAGVEAALKAFAILAGGHASLGEFHTGVILAETLAGRGDLPGALALLGEVRARDASVGGALHVRLMLAARYLDAAETLLDDLLARTPTDRDLLVLAAELRVRRALRQPAELARVALDLARQ